MQSFFFFNDTATTEIYTLSLHDALPISRSFQALEIGDERRDIGVGERRLHPGHQGADRKSTRLNSSHSQISYAVFCLKKKKKGKLGAAPPRWRQDVGPRTRRSTCQRRPL